LDRSWRTEGESFGQSIGIAYEVLALLGVIPYIGTIFSVASFVVSSFTGYRSPALADGWRRSPMTIGATTTGITTTTTEGVGTWTTGTATLIPTRGISANRERTPSLPYRTPRRTILAAA
jgi:hypothetical protein